MGHNIFIHHIILLSLNRLTYNLLFHLNRSSQFYLVLDVTNLTAQEMMLNYTTNKNIVIEARENCRVPVPVERCPRIWRDQKIDDQQDQTSKLTMRYT